MGSDSVEIRIEDLLQEILSELQAIRAGIDTLIERGNDE